jgi:DNA-binding SARP family transcriptional activator
MSTLRGARTVGVQFKLLGDVSCLIDGVPVDIGHRRQRSVLAVLLLNANRPVPVECLIDRVWSASAPLRARTTLYGYVHHLRRALDTTGARLLTREEGYRLVVDPMSVDVHRFARLAAQGWTSGERVLFDLALGLWQDEPLAGLESPWFDAVREDLRRQKLAVELDRNDAWLRAGRHQQLLPVLAAMTADLPLDERLAHQFMLAAYRCGRQDEALRRFDAIRARLAEELGADPGEALRTLHRRVLAADPGLCLPSSGGPRRPVPRQLPTPPRLFVGRTSEFAALDGYLGAGRAPSPAAVIAVVHGPCGIGKTALTLHWAQSRVDLFPDGQLYADLRTENPLRGFLDALGVEPSAVPSDPGDCAALYRSLVAGRRMLIVLDHATDADQVRSLLAGSPANTVIVTSRDPLIELVATHGAHSLQLDALPADQARQLLAGHIGERRIANEPVAVSAILYHCRGIPLALSTAAARSLVSRSRFG